jgi:hypothetical protein
MRSIPSVACIFVLSCLSLAAQQPDVKSPEPPDRIRKAAEAGDAKAMTELGKLALRQRDPQLIEALKWFRKAVELGDTNAMAQLGRMYSLGWAGPKSDEKRSSCSASPRKRETEMEWPTWDNCIGKAALCLRTRRKR